MILPAGLVLSILPLLLAVAVVGSNSLSLSPIAPEIALDLGVAVESVMIASAGFGFGTAFGALVLARWVDYFGPLNALRVAFAVLFTSMLACIYSHGIVFLSAAQALAGVAAGVALPAVYARAAFVAPSGHESRVLGVVLVGWTLSLVAGVSLAAWIADAMSWRRVYALLAILSLLVFLSTFLMQGRHVARPTQAAPSPFRALRVPGVAGLLLLVALYMVSFYASYAFVGDHVVSVLKQTVSSNGWIAVSYGMGFGLAALFDGWLDKLGARRATPLTLLLLAVVYLLLAMPVGFNWLLALCFFWGLANHLAVNTLIARLSAADPDQRGTVLGLYSGVTYFCMSVATLWAGLLYQLAGWLPINWAAMGLCLLAALIARQSLQNSPRNG